MRSELEGNSELRRKHQRIASRIPIRIGGRAIGETRDVSPSGAYLVISQGVFLVGELIRFSMAFEATASSPAFDLTCVGQIMRVETVEGRFGVAVEITDARLERAESRRQEDHDMPGGFADGRKDTVAFR